MQYMYTIDDDARLMFLPATARAAILRSGAQAGDTIALTKIKRGGETIFGRAAASRARSAEARRTFAAAAADLLPAGERRASRQGCFASPPWGLHHVMRRRDAKRRDPLRSP